MPRRSASFIAKGVFAALRERGFEQRARTPGRSRYHRHPAPLQRHWYSTRHPGVQITTAAAREGESYRVFVSLQPGNQVMTTFELINASPESLAPLFQHLDNYKQAII